ncbi:MAG: methyltransferase domain-containing protein [Cyclobacteriaceae bacterium]
MTDISKYDQEFYENRDNRTRYAAKRILKIVNDLVEPSSAVDLGCGVGTWLDVFKEYGVGEVLGIEGPWVDKSHLVINSDEFMSAELNKPLNTERKFDLAISLEVAEHIEEEYADNFVKNLVQLAPVILFSAAIPLQGGRNHVNEQWPSYWSEKFAGHGYVVVDAIRNEVWEDEKNDVWNAQNCFIYIHEK